MKEDLAAMQGGASESGSKRSIKKVKLIKATAEHEETAVVPEIWERDSDKKKIVEKNCCTRKRKYSEQRWFRV